MAPTETEASVTARQPTEKPDTTCGKASRESNLEEAIYQFYAGERFK